jgi:hypothetical protein
LFARLAVGLYMKGEKLRNHEPALAEETILVLMFFLWKRNVEHICQTQPCLYWSMLGPSTCLR